MISIYLQYLILLNKIRKSKQKGYKGLEVHSIYPVNQERLKEKGYTIFDPNFIRSNYIIRWDE